MAFTLNTNSTFEGYAIRASLRPSGKMFHRDCNCGKALLSWDNIEIIDGVAVWYLTTEQSASLPEGEYAMEIALRDVGTSQDIKATTIGFIKIVKSYTIQ